MSNDKVYHSTNNISQNPYRENEDQRQAQSMSQGNLDHQESMGLAGLHLIFDPDSQKVYQKDSNGKLYLSEFQLLDQNQKQGPGQAYTN